MTIPAGQKAARFVLNAANDQSDWDLYVLGPNGSGGLKQFTAATGSASESLVVPNPIAGTYYVIANLFASPGSTATDAVIQAAAWAGDAGNATVAPKPIVAANGTQATETLSWNGLSTGAYMGRFTFGSSGITSWVNLAVGSAAGAAAPAGAPSMSTVDSVPGQ